MKDKKNVLKYILGTIGAAVLIASDQISKHYAVEKLEAEPKVIIDGVFELRYLENTGGAWGIMGAHTWLLTIFTVIILGLIILLYTRLPAKKQYIMPHIYFIATISGAVGNLIDRLKNGYVVDFLYFKLINFPIFNLADIFLTVSITLFAVWYIFISKDEELFRLKLKKSV